MVSSRPRCKSHVNLLVTYPRAGAPFKAISSPNLDFLWRLLILVVLVRRLSHQRVSWVVADRLNDAEALGATFSEEQAVTGSEILWALNEAEGNRCPVASSDEFAVNVDDGAGLGDRAHMQHGLVLGLDGCGV